MSTHYIAALLLSTWGHIVGYIYLATRMLQKDPNLVITIVAVAQMEAELKMCEYEVEKLRIIAKDDKEFVLFLCTSVHHDSFLTESWMEIILELSQGNEGWPKPCTPLAKNVSSPRRKTYKLRAPLRALIPHRLHPALPPPPFLNHLFNVKMPACSAAYISALPYSAPPPTCPLLPLPTKAVKRAQPAPVSVKKAAPPVPRLSEGYAFVPPAVALTYPDFYHLIAAGPQSVAPKRKRAVFQTLTNHEGRVHLPKRKEPEADLADESFCCRDGEMI
ncbi:hypothetical protein DFH09DRAFT_1309270 [Mycena vulgaris]|nr:hypothetical protein DFH09DRAFT_1309270 [Mycena vulgaris]